MADPISDAASCTMSSCCVVHLGEPSTEPIAGLVRERLGARASAGEWETSKAAALILLVECDPDGTACDVARKFLKDVKRSDCFANYSASIKRRVATLALCKSTCANSAAMLARQVFRRQEAAGHADRRHGCTALKPVTCAEIEIEEVTESVLPWADAVVAALDALAPVET